MSARTVDTLAVSQLLRKRGFTEDQAIGVVEAFREIDASALATKADLDDLRRDLRAVEVRLEAKIETSSASLKVEILRWLIVTQIALGGFIFAMLKLVR